tara:strand:+ start:1096 stop:1233 length:138 start_codon:yes stop_codon:yes gene_type:complete
MTEEMKKCIAKSWITAYIWKLINEEKDNDFNEVLIQLAEDIHLKL